MSGRKRNPPEHPLHKEVGPFVKWHLADKGALAPLTGTDWDAWKAFLYLVRLWGRTRSQAIVDAMRAVIASAQTRNADVMAVFKKSIPCLLDWSDEPKLWRLIGPTIPGRSGIVSIVQGERDNVIWPCTDGPRVCHHTNSRPYPDEPGYRECTEKGCGAVWNPAAIKKESR